MSNCACYLNQAASAGRHPILLLPSPLTPQCGKMRPFFVSKQYILNWQDCVMDKLTRYRELIKRILTEYQEIARRRPTSGIEHLLLMDDERGHYLWLKLGWLGDERINNITVHVHLRDGKFWIEEDWTEDGIATDLLEAGVPKEDIVLAFHHPEERPYTEFAAA